MAFITADRIKETTTVTGTGPITLLGAVSGYRTFASQLSIGDTCAYAIVNANASEWEVGIGTYSAVNTLTRTTVHASTNSNAVVNFSAGTKDVFLSPTAETVLSDVTSTDGTVTLTKTGSIVDLSVAVAAATTNVIVQVRNNTGATLTKGTVVYINDALGQLPTVAKALATSDATSAQTLGMISADLGDNANGYVTIIGLIDDISLDTGIYNDGDQLYLSGTTAGAFTNVKPYAPTHLVYVGVVEHAHNIQGKIFVKVQNGYELDELHDVSAQNPSNGQTIVYNSTNQLWEKNYVSRTNSLSAVPVVSGAGNSLTLAAGSGVGTGAGGSLILSAGAQATSGGDGNIRFTNSSNTNYAAINAGFTQQINFYANTILSFTISSYIPQRGYIGAPSTGGFAWADNATGDFSNHGDLYLSRDAANTLAQRNGTNPQSFRVYNTYTSASVYERASLSWASNVCTLTTESTTAGAGRNLVISAGNGVTSGAGGSLILQAGIQATSGGDGKVIVKQVAGQTSNLQEWQDSSGNIRGYISATDSSTIARFSLERSGGSEGFYVTTTNGGTRGLWLTGSMSAAFGCTAVNNTDGGSIVTGSAIATRGDVGEIGFGAGTNPASRDVVLRRDAADTLAQRRSTNPQSFRVYNTYTDASNYERLGITWATNICTIGLAQAGTGSTRNLVVAGANATTGAGGNVTITAGNGSGVGAGGNIILQPGAQGTSGGNGKVRINDTAGVDTGFNFTRGYAGYPTLDQSRLELRHNLDNNFVIELRADIGISIGIANGQLLLGNGTNFVGIKEVSNSGTLGIRCATTLGASLSFPNATTAIAANTNDLALPASAFQRLNCTSPCSLTGIAPVTGTGSVHVDGRMIRVYNVGTANLTLSHNSASSAAANRFYNATGADIVLSTHQYVELIYDSTDNGRGGAGWRVSSVH